MRKSTLFLLTILCIALTSGCVYRAAISQGNLINQQDIDQIEIGMTVSQVRFLLGTPMVNDAFSQNRWDYVYYLKIGRKETINKRWISVYFEDEAVSEIHKDQQLSPTL